MPIKPRPGVRPLYVEFPEATYRLIEEAAGRNGRTVKSELLRAVDRHLAAPEVLLTPPLNGTEKKSKKSRRTSMTSSEHSTDKEVTSEKKTDNVP